MGFRRYVPVLLAVLFVLGLLAVVVVRGSSSSKLTQPSASGSHSTSTVAVSPFVSSFSAACNTALAPARSALAKVAGGEKLSQAELGALSASTQLAAKVCTQQEYYTFQVKELLPLEKH